MAAKKTTTVVAVELTAEQRATANALLMREGLITKADRARARTAEVADATRGYAAATAGTALLGIACTGTFLKRLVFGAPKVVVPRAAVDTDAQLRAVLMRHGLL